MAKTIKDRQRSTPLSLAPLRETTRFKKHVVSSLDRVRKGSHNIDGDENVHAATLNLGISPIPESALEGGVGDDVEETVTVPVGSKLAERSSAQSSRSRPVLLRARRRESHSPIPQEGTSL